MNYTDIHTFLTIASSSSLSKAAEALYVSQPALSHRLLALEKELGMELIVRRKGVRTIELTEAGKRFLPIAGKWEQLWEETSRIGMQPFGELLRISNVDSLNFCFMPKVVRSFLQKNPHHRLELSTMRSNVAYEAVENHEVDLAFITNPHFFKKVHTVPLFEEKLVFVCDRDGKYGPETEPSKLNSSEEIYIPWSNTFLMWHDYWFGNSPDKKVALDNMSLLEQLLQLKDTWAVVPATVAQILCAKGECSAVPLKNPPKPRTCFAIFNDQGKDNPILSTFVQEVKMIAADFSEISILSEEPFS